MKFKKLGLKKDPLYQINKLTDKLGKGDDYLVWMKFADLLIKSE